MARNGHREIDVIGWCADGDAEPCQMVQDRGNRLKNTTESPCIERTKIV